MDGFYSLCQHVHCLVRCLFALLVGVPLPWQASSIENYVTQGINQAGVPRNVIKLSEISVLGWTEQDIVGDTRRASEI